ncbi:uncharacterized protein KY384_007222 [Bacidia gigantensis]|uniref:uncharacterized protein n=1 Tax=Bacidia gigantensis TaxID=2732470 RepID=UPI001D039BD6|nr:uncharacterized protein KY384_007222 [Bacidia gigantensis]KAG8528305.1 hypothetical protein KY384_007222 [Bacidia gigantensis]
MMPWGNRRPSASEKKPKITRRITDIATGRATKSNREGPEDPLLHSQGGGDDSYPSSTEEHSNVAEEDQASRDLEHDAETSNIHSSSSRDRYDTSMVTATVETSVNTQDTSASRDPSKNITGDYFPTPSGGMPTYPTRKGSLTTSAFHGAEVKLNPYEIYPYPNPEAQSDSQEYRPDIQLRPEEISPFSKPSRYRSRQNSPSNTPQVQQSPQVTSPFHSPYMTSGPQGAFAHHHPTAGFRPMDSSSHQQSSPHYSRGVQSGPQATSPFQSPSMPSGFQGTFTHQHHIADSRPKESSSHQVAFPHAKPEEQPGSEASSAQHTSDARFRFRKTSGPHQSDSSLVTHDTVMDNVTYGTPPEQILYPVRYGSSEESEDVSFVSLDYPSSPSSKHSTSSAPGRKRAGSFNFKNLLHASPKLHRRQGQSELRSEDFGSHESPTALSTTAKPQTGGRLIPEISTPELIALGWPASEEIIDNAIKQALDISDKTGLPFMILQDGRSCLDRRNDGGFELMRPEEWKSTLKKQLNFGTPSPTPAISTSAHSSPPVRNALMKTATASSTPEDVSKSPESQRSAKRNKAKELIDYIEESRIVDLVAGDAEKKKKERVVPASPRAAYPMGRQKRGSYSMSDVTKITTPTKITPASIRRVDDRAPTPPPKNDDESPRIQIKRTGDQRPRGIRIGAAIPNWPLRESSRDATAATAAAEQSAESPSDSINSSRYSGDENSVQTAQAVRYYQPGPATALNSNPADEAEKEFARGLTRQGAAAREKAEAEKEEAARREGPPVRKAWGKMGLGGRKGGEGGRGRSEGEAYETF